MIRVFCFCIIIVQNQRQAVISLIYRLHNLKIVADRVGKQVCLQVSVSVMSVFCRGSVRAVRGRGYLKDRWR